MSVADMVKHSVSLDTAIFAIGVDWRAAVCGAALLGVYLLQCLWLVRVQTLQLPARTLTRRCALYRIATVEGRAIAGRRIIALGKQPPACLLRRARTSSCSRRIRPRPVAVPLLDRGGSVSQSSTSWTAVCHSGMCWPQRPICSSASCWVDRSGMSRAVLWKRGWIHRTRALLLLSRGVATSRAHKVLERWRRLGSFGAGGPAIAVAHTLYAPREMVLWNWRRILLLGLSLALAPGTSSRSVW